jgi:DNA polymerase III sliding clamp (beta) subunit (PCNA family)
MNVNREKFLNSLEMVRAGLSPREYVEQSSCLVFKDNEVMTFNDEVACRVAVDVSITGAVQSAALFDILGKIDDEELTIEENEDGELEFRGKRKSFGLTKEAEIFLPIDRVERPEKWHSLPKDFIEAVGMVHHCVSNDESKFTLTCVHITKDWVEACDNFQLMRCMVALAIKGPVLVRGTSLRDLVSLAVDKVALTKSWIHFKNQAGLVYSCRRYSETYTDLEKLLKAKGHKIVIPKGLATASERAAVFAADATGESHVTVTLQPGKVRIKGEGASGWYREVSKVAYDGPPMEFVIAPDLLKQISEKYSDAQISEGRLKVTGGAWEFVTVLGKKAEVKEEPSEE